VKSQIFFLGTILILILAACTHRTTYTITKLSVKPDSLYNDEATLFLGKPITIKQFDKAVELQVGNGTPLFLQFRSQNNNYEKTNNPLDYNISYSAETNGVYYDLECLKTKDGTLFLQLELQKRNSHPTDTTHYSSGNIGLGAALMRSEQNQVHVTITAEP